MSPTKALQYKLHYPHLQKEKMALAKSANHSCVSVSFGSYMASGNANEGNLLLI